MGKRKNHLSGLKTAVAVCALLGVGAGQSYAQPAQLEQQVITADPGTVDEQFQRPSILPSASPEVSVESLQTQGAPEGAENIRFVLRSINFDGMDSLSAAQVERVYAGKLGTEITLAELYGIANAVTAEYRNNGYILTRVVIPPQTIDDGNVRFQVVEGYINNIVIQGPEEEAGALELIRQYASNISTGGALNIAQLERELLIINDLPGISARSILSPSSVPGAADILIIVERDPWDALASVDNYGSRYLGPLQLTGGFTANSWFGTNEAITAQAAFAPDNGLELAYGALSYEAPIGSMGTKLRLFASKTRTEPGFDLTQFDVKGQSDLYSLQATHPFIRSRNTNLVGRAIFDWRDVESKNNIELTRKDRIRALRIGGRYDFLDTLFGVAVNAIDIEVSQGLNILGASQEGRANLTRAQGDPQFTKIQAEYQRLQRINDDFNLLLVGRGQLSADALLSSEEFSIGGINLGRGYDPSEITGDDGIAGKAEIQWNNPYTIDAPYIDSYQLYGFFDIGTVWDQDPTTAAQKRDSISSTGTGVRVNFTGDTQADLAIAFPLTREVQTQGDDDPKVYFGLNKRF